MSSLANDNRAKDECAKALAQASALRAGLRARDAADIIHALASPEVYRSLVVDRKWSDDRFERWLSNTLASQLLGDTSR